MKPIKIMKYSLLLAALIFAVQYVFIEFLPNIAFQIAKYRSAQPLNTVIRAPKTDASLRRVVLPNPDFIYNACFYDVSENDLIITGTFPDTNQYYSVSFYGSNVQPFYVMNNLQGRKRKYSVRLSSSSRVNGTLRAVSKQGVVLMRVLSTNSEQEQSARQLQKEFRAIPVAQNE